MRVRAVLVGLLVVSCVLVGCAGHEQASTGNRAPSFAAADLETGQRTNLDKYRQGVTLVNTWATWCIPCRKEMPALQDLYAEHRTDHFTVVGVNVDEGDAKRKVSRYLDDIGVSFPNLLDPDNEFQRVFRSVGVPESVLIAADGTILHRWRGPIDEDFKETRRIIDAAIAGNKIEPADPRVTFGVLGLFAAVLAGLLSFLSPCVLPLVPSYAAFLMGVHTAGQSASARRRQTLMHAVAFVLGFSAVFIAFGASATVLGGAFRDHAEVISRIGGILLLIFGLVLFGAIPIAMLQREVRLLDRARVLRRFGPIGSSLVGAAFGAGWTPCIGPVLGGILALAATGSSTAEGVVLLTCYSAGLAIPFLAAAVAIERFNALSPRLKSWLPWINRISGALLVGLGILLLTGALSQLSAWFARYLPTWIG